MPFSELKIYSLLSRRARVAGCDFLAEHSHISQMLKNEWKSYFIQPSRAPCCDAGEGGGGKLHNELHTIVKQRKALLGWETLRN